MSTGALFPALGGSRSGTSKNLVEFRAGKMTLKGKTVTADKRKGLVYIHQTDDSLIHFCWKNRTNGMVDDDLIIFPDDCEFKRVSQCTTGRVYVLKFKAGSKRLFFWMQEPSEEKDEENCKKVNEFLNNPPSPGSGGAGGGHDLSALGGEGGLQNLLGNMSHNQLMQLIGSSGLGGLGGLGALAGPGLASLLGSGGSGSGGGSSSSSRSQSAGVSSSGAASRSSGPTSSQTTSTPTASTASTPTVSTASTPTSTASTTTTTSSTSSSSTTTAAGSASHQPIQLSDLQNILATMNVPPTATVESSQGSSVDLSSVCTPEMMAPILSNADVQQRLLPFLPAGESLPQSTELIANTLSSPQFQQSMSIFSSALASGQLGPLMSQFGLPAAAVEAANRGDVEAFARAMQSSRGDGEGKKGGDDEDMNLD
ncbi:proteasomal ubiquitin receptor ADRM1-like isoform 2-T2 [Pholidichthys leucotaenia]